MSEKVLPSGEKKWSVDNQPWQKPIKDFKLKKRKVLFTDQGTLNPLGKKLFTKLHGELGKFIEEYIDEYKPNEFHAIIDLVSRNITASYAATLFHLCNNNSKAYKRKNV